MKKVFTFSCVLALIICLFSGVSFASSDTQATDSFKKYASDTMTKVLGTYTGTHYQISYIPQANYPYAFPSYWVKSIGAVDPDYKINVEKNNSPTTPYVATLEVTYKNTFYQIAPSKELAESSTIISTTQPFLYKFTLVLQDGKWCVTDAEQYDPAMNKWFKANNLDIFEELKCKDENH